MADYCSYSNILSSKNHCEFTKIHCTGELMNFTKMHYCDFSEQYVFTIIVFVIIAIVCFRIIGTTSSEYLSNSLTTISEILKFSQNLAGVTFLAMGNGAPDIIASIVASDVKTKDTNMNFSLSVLLGGGLFVTTLVFSLVTFKGDSVKVRKNLFLRDVFFYVIALTTLLFFSIFEEIRLWHSIVFLCIYVMYTLS